MQNNCIKLDIKKNLLYVFKKLLYFNSFNIKKI